MSFESIDNKNLWNELFDSAPHSNLINVNLLPHILDNIDLETIVDYIINEINDYKLPKKQLARFKVLEILMDKTKHETEIVKIIIFKKYYRDIYKCFDKSNEHIVRWTIITNFKKIYNNYKNSKIIKYYNMMNNQFKIK